MAIFSVDRETLAVYRRLLGYATRYWKIFVIALIAMAVYGATVTGFAALVKPLLDGTFVQRDPVVIRYMPFAVLALFLARGAAGFAGSFGMDWIGRRVIKELRQELFEKLLVLPATFYDRSSSGVLLSKLTFNIEQVAESATRAVTIAVRDSLTIIGLVGLMVYLDPMLSLFVFVMGPLIGLLISFVSGRFRGYSTRIQNSMGDLTQVAEQAIEGQRVIKVFGGQEYESREFDIVNENNRRLFMKLVAVKAGSIPIIQFIAAIGIAGIIFFATQDISSANLSAGGFGSFMSAMLLLMDPLKRLTDINVIIQRGIAAAISIFAVLDEDSEPDTGTVPLARAKGDLSFRSVSFAYDENKGEVLRDISFDVKAGQTVAFVGRSGSGKSTLVGLLPRFYEVDTGRIELDGRNIVDYPRKVLREQIALVSQDIILFNDTIARNIGYGDLQQTPREALEAAAQAAHVMEFVNDLPDGLDTMVGDRGVLLSGGQRQRIAIARALLKNAPILILDEATSSLDTESERRIKTALDALMQNRTTLVIAHRLSTVETADRIIVLDSGRIVESGTHRELLAAGGRYSSLYRMQFDDG